MFEKMKKIEGVHPLGGGGRGTVEPRGTTGQPGLGLPDASRAKRSSLVQKDGRQREMKIESRCLKGLLREKVGRQATGGRSSIMG